MWSWIVFLFLLLTGTCSATGNACDGARREIMRAMRQSGLPGLSVAVVRDGRLIWAEGFGYANVETHAPATAQTVYEIGSLGKQFTAVGVELLAADGRLNLDSALSDFLPELPLSWSDVTIRRMLIHQSGIAQIAPPDRYLLDLQKDYTPAQYVALATSVPLEFKPGLSSSYSDTAYVLLGFVMDRVIGGFYGDFLAERIFSPLGMTHTQIIDAHHAPRRLAQGYERHGKRLEVQQPVSMTLNRTADGSLWSTVLDLARWEAALGSGTVIPRTTIERMWRVPPLANGQMPLYHYGEGWERNRLRDTDVIEYDGSWQGFHGAMARYPSLGLMVVVLGNLADWRAQRLVHAIAGHFDRRARPYQVIGANSGCERAIERWLKRQPIDESSLSRELAAIGPIRSVRAAERVGAGGDPAWVYRIEAAQMDDWMTISCGHSRPQLVDLYREY
jgi:CubicO group peptidase (beta-lactamase class C family)